MSVLWVWLTVTVSQPVTQIRNLTNVSPQKTWEGFICSFSTRDQHEYITETRNTKPEIFPRAHWKQFSSRKTKTERVFVKFLCQGRRGQSLLWDILIIHNSSICNVSAVPPNPPCPHAPTPHTRTNIHFLCADVYTTVRSVEVPVSKGRVLRGYSGTGQCRQNCELMMSCYCWSLWHLFALIVLNTTCSQCKWVLILIEWWIDFIDWLISSAHNFTSSL